MLIVPHVTDPDFLPYDDDYQKARVQGELITKNMQMWESLYSADPSLSYTKKLAMDAMGIVYEEKKYTMSDKGKDDWVATVSSRLRAQGRHIAQASLKRPPPDFEIREIFKKRIREWP